MCRQGGVRSTRVKCPFSEPRFTQKNVSNPRPYSHGPPWIYCVFFHYSLKWFILPWIKIFFVNLYTTSQPVTASPVFGCLFLLQTMIEFFIQIRSFNVIGKSKYKKWLLKTYWNVLSSINDRYIFILYIIYFIFVISKYRT